MQIQRLQYQNLKNKVAKGHVVVLYGPRRSGKTTLVHEYLNNINEKALFLDADLISVREVLSRQSVNEFKKLIGDSKLLIVDEAQRVADIGLNLKIIVDNFKDVAVVATGSASFDLANKINEPLTGRKSTLTLYPVAFSELVQTHGVYTIKNKLEDWLIFGGYPSSILADSRSKKIDFLNELVSSYLYKDMLDLVDVRKSEKIIDLLRLLAFQLGQEVSIAELASSLALSRDAVERYLDLLEKVFVIFKVRGFSRNLRKEVIKNSRYYFFDNGVYCSVIQNFNQLNIRDDVGRLWENYLVSERLKVNHYKSNYKNIYFWRTYDQKEIDLVEEGGGKLDCFEFKYNNDKFKQTTMNEFAAAYPNSSFKTINKENFDEFLK